jgi:hypothetical protein
MKKIGIIGIISNPVTSLSSHNGGWTLCLKSMLTISYGLNVDVLTEKDDWDKYHTLFISEGINYEKGKYNFFGGVDDKVKTRLMKLSSFKGYLYSINKKIDYNDMCIKRKELKDFVDIKFRIPRVFKTNEYNDKLILGDSHSVSVFKPGYSIDVNNGKTLHGFLKKGLKSYIKESTRDLIFYAGNIDIRFHVHRFDSMNTISQLILELEKQLIELNLKNISLVSLLPIEDESRELPKSGLYKGEKFFGSKEERSSYVKFFNNRLKEICNRNGFNYLEWDLVNKDELSFNEMESRRSVHLRPTSYMFIEDILQTKQQKLF